MYRPFASCTDFCTGFFGISSLLTQRRFWAKPKKRPKVGANFHEKAQKWRQEYLLDRHRVLADSLRAYIDFSSTKRTEPWDTRFAPFDRIEKDGVHIVRRYLMDEKLQLCNCHHRPVKRLFCNVGLFGPNVTTNARWKPYRHSTNSASATKMEQLYSKDKTVMTDYHND